MASGVGEKSKKKFNSGIKIFLSRKKICVTIVTCTTNLRINIKTFKMN